MVNNMVTPTQHKIYQFIKQFVDKHDYAPSLQEIAHGIGIKSRSLISRYVHALEKSGYLELAEDGHRKIRLASSNDEMTLPLVGKIAAGLPIEAVTQQDHLVLKDLLVGEGRYALMVKGDSMINEGILEGDIVICEKREQAHEGEIVVALIDNQEATLKRIHFSADGNITLKPANSAYQAQIYAAHRVYIQGVFVGLLRLPPRLPRRAIAHQ